jgi:hypothetical protein
MRTQVVLAYAFGLGCAACGDALTESAYQGGQSARLTPQAPQGMGDAPLPDLSGSTQQQGLSCDISGFSPQSIGSLFDPAVVDHLRLTSISQDGTSAIRIDNYPTLPHGVAPGTSMGLALDPNASSSDCGFCIVAEGKNGDVFTVERGTADVEQPADRLSIVKVTFTNLVLVHRSASGDTTRWCVPQLTLQALPQAWACADLNVVSTDNVCFANAKTRQSSVVTCRNGLVTSRQKCAANACTLQNINGQQTAICGGQR